MSTTAVSSAKSVSGVLEDDFHGAGAPTTESTASPRVSTALSAGRSVDEDPPAGKSRQVYPTEGADYSAPGLDSLHWAGVKKRGDFDQRSVASSMNAEKDDKSIYEEHAAGAAGGEMLAALPGASV